MEIVGNKEIIAGLRRFDTAQPKLSRKVKK